MPPGVNDVERAIWVAEVLGIRFPQVGGQTVGLPVVEWSRLWRAALIRRLLADVERFWPTPSDRLACRPLFRRKMLHPRTRGPQSSDRAQSCQYAERPISSANDVKHPPE